MRTTHLTGITTDIGVLLGHQLGRQLQTLTRRMRGEPQADAARAAARKIVADERTQLKLQSARGRRRERAGRVTDRAGLTGCCARARPRAGLLLVSFFCGSVAGMGLYNRWAANALLMPAGVEAAMGLGYLVYRTVLRPRWKARRMGRAAERRTSTRSEVAAATVEPAQLPAPVATPQSKVATPVAGSGSYDSTMARFDAEEAAAAVPEPDSSDDDESP